MQFAKTAQENQVIVPPHALHVESKGEFRGPLGVADFSVQHADWPWS
jgi:hypothetical protein